MDGLNADFVQPSVVAAKTVAGAPICCRALYLVWNFRSLHFWLLADQLHHGHPHNVTNVLQVQTTA
jgi:hypothetical protein